MVLWFGVAVALLPPLAAQVQKFLCSDPLTPPLRLQMPHLSRAEGTYALVIAPTRELCLQIQDVALQLLRKYHWLVGYPGATPVFLFSLNDCGSMDLVENPEAAAQVPLAVRCFAVFF